MASGVFNLAKKKMWDGSIALLTDTIKVMLVTSSYTFNQDHDFVSSANSAEISVTNYTGAFGGSGRKTLASKVITEDDTNDRAYFDAADVPWTALGSGATVAAAILIKEVTTDADSFMIAYLDFTDTATNGGDFTIQWDSTGVIRLA